MKTFKLVCLLARKDAAAFATVSTVTPASSKAKLLILTKMPAIARKKILYSSACLVTTDMTTPLGWGTLAPLIGIDDLRCSMAVQSLVEHVNRVTGLQGDRNLCDHDVPAGPINNGNKGDKSSGHGDRAGS